MGRRLSQEHQCKKDTIDEAGINVTNLMGSYVRAKTSLVENIKFAMVSLFDEVKTYDSLYIKSAVEHCCGH